MSLDRAWHVSPTADRANVLIEGIVPDAATGETEVWLLAEESWALTWAADGEELSIHTPEGFADIWSVDITGIAVHVHEHIREEPSLVIEGAIAPARLRLIKSL